MKPGEIAEAAHRVCVDELIPNGVSYDHGLELHAISDDVYRKAIEDAGLEVTGQQVVDAIFELVPWDRRSQWPGHPTPDQVVNHLQRAPAGA